MVCVFCLVFMFCNVLLVLVCCFGFMLVVVFCLVLFVLVVSVGWIVGSE